MRQIHRSENGDAWLLVRDEAEVVAVEHRPNAPSGGRISRKSLGAFLSDARGSPESRALLRLVATLVDEAPAGPETS